jgi:glycopeptide antibiotics resistance protein
MRRLVVGKGAQGALLSAYTVLLLVGTLVLQGAHEVRTNLVPFEDLSRILVGAGKAGLLSNRVAYALAALAGNLLLFAIWGFLAWKLLDSPGRSRLFTHLEVTFLGLVFSVGIETVQLFLPTRAADVNDVFWNSIGALLGSVGAHVHAVVEIEWG